MAFYNQLIHWNSHGSQRISRLKMTSINQFLHSKSILAMTAFLLLTSCAYFNTFYNARYYFKQAEKQRLQKAGESIPPSAIDAYGKVIDKSQYVLDKFPDSKYYPEALFLIGKSRFHRKEYRSARRAFLRNGFY